MPRVLRWLGDARQDGRRALRGLRANPAFSLTSVTLLALGIGATTAIFSVVNAVLIAPLPFAQPDRLVQIFESHPEGGWDRFSFSHPNGIDIRERSTSFVDVGLYGGRSATLTGDGIPQQIALATVTPGFFDVLGVSPLVGRTLQDSDVEGVQARAVILLSEDLWVSRFGADPGVVGRTVELDATPHEVVGVLPRGMGWLDRDAFEPMALDPERSRTDHRLAAIGRLSPGVGIGTARAELSALATRIKEESPDADSDLDFVVDSSDIWAASMELRRSLWIFLGATGLLLAVACLNLANLQLARLDRRLRQVTLSLALGASRGRVVRQLLTESAVLSLLGGMAGILVARAGLAALLALEPGDIPRMDQVSVDGTVLGFGIAIALLSGVGAGMLPAVRIFSGRLGNALREGGGKASGGPGASRAQSWLVGVETSLSLVLLIGAGLLARSLAEVQRVENGFETEGRITFEVPTPGSYGVEETNALMNEFLARVRALPDVISAAAVSMRPVRGGNTVMGILPRGQTAETFGGTPSANWRLISDEYFQSLGLTITRGSDLSHRTAADGAMEIVISDALARLLWAGEDPIGREAALWADPDNVGTVVGVVEDMRERGPEQEETLAVYFTYALGAWSPINFVVHAEGDPTAVVPDVRRILGEIDPMLPLSRTLTMDDMVRDSSASRRFTMMLLVVFAGAALVLTLVGLYAVIAQSVSQRARDLGVRIALGASAGQIVRLVMRRGLVPALTGIVVGLAATVWASRLLASLVFGVSTTDPLTYVGVGLLMALAAAVACWVPARSALGMHVSQILREE